MISQYEHKEQMTSLFTDGEAALGVVRQRCRESAAAQIARPHVAYWRLQAEPDAAPAERPEGDDEQEAPQ